MGLAVDKVKQLEMGKFEGGMLSGLKPQQPFLLDGFSQVRMFSLLLA